MLARRRASCCAPFDGQNKDANKDGVAVTRDVSPERSPKRLLRRTPSRGENQFASGDVRRAYATSVDERLDSRSLFLSFSFSLSRVHIRATRRIPEITTATVVITTSMTMMVTTFGTSKTRTLTSPSSSRARARAHDYRRDFRANGSNVPNVNAATRGTTVCCRSRYGHFARTRRPSVRDHHRRLRFSPPALLSTSLPPPPARFRAPGDLPRAFRRS